MSNVVNIVTAIPGAERCPGEAVAALVDTIARIYLAEFTEFYHPDEFSESVGRRIEGAISRLSVMS